MRYKYTVWKLIYSLYKNKLFEFFQAHKILWLIQWKPLLWKLSEMEFEFNLIINIIRSFIIEVEITFWSLKSKTSYTWNQVQH